VTTIRELPAGVVTVPRTTEPRWRRGKETFGAGGESPGAGSAGVPSVEPGGAVVVPVGGVVVVPLGSPTLTVPVIDEWAPQTNAYVPGLSNRQVPLQPAGAGFAGSGGTAPVSLPVAWEHVVGWRPEKTTLWKDSPLG
jgi:hypothetical protein